MIRWDVFQMNLTYKPRAEFDAIICTMDDFDIIFQSINIINIKFEL